MSLVQKLLPLRKTSVVDVGAAPIDEVPPYLPLIRMPDRATLTAFEPNPDMFAKMGAGENITVHQRVVGDGLPASMHYCAAPGMNSILRPNEMALGAFTSFTEYGRVVKTEPVMTVPLDDIVKEMDYLKIDVQGAELIVFDGATRLLDKAVVVHAEASFVPLYHGQPTFGDLDADLRSRGFLPHRIIGPKYWPLSPNRSHAQQLLEMDIVYVRDFMKMERMSDQQLMHLAIIALSCYGASNLAERCVDELTRRGALTA